MQKTIESRADEKSYMYEFNTPIGKYWGLTIRPFKSPEEIASSKNKTINSRIYEHFRDGIIKGSPWNENDKQAQIMEQVISAYGLCNCKCYYATKEEGYGINNFNFAFETLSKYWEFYESKQSSKADMDFAEILYIENNAIRRDSFLNNEAGGQGTFYHKVDIDLKSIIKEYNESNNNNCYLSEEVLNRIKITTEDGVNYFTWGKGNSIDGFLNPYRALTGLFLGSMTNLQDINNFLENDRIIEIFDQNATDLKKFINALQKEIEISVSEKIQKPLAGLTDVINKAIEEQDPWKMRVKLVLNTKANHKNQIAMYRKTSTIDFFARSVGTYIFEGIHSIIEKNVTVSITPTLNKIKANNAKIEYTYKNMRPKEWQYNKKINQDINKTFSEDAPQCWPVTLLWESKKNKPDFWVSAPNKLKNKFDLSSIAYFHLKFLLKDGSIIENAKNGNWDPLRLKYKGYLFFNDFNNFKSFLEEVYDMDKNLFDGANPRNMSKDGNNIIIKKSEDASKDGDNGIIISEDKIASIQDDILISASKIRRNFISYNSDIVILNKRRQKYNKKAQNKHKYSKFVQEVYSIFSSKDGNFGSDGDWRPGVLKIY